MKNKREIEAMGDTLIIARVECASYSETWCEAQLLCDCMLWDFAMGAASTVGRHGLQDYSWNAMTQLLEPYDHPR